MRLARGNSRDQEAERGDAFRIPWICRARCGDRWWAGSGTSARGVRHGSGRQRQCRGLRGDVGVAGRWGGIAVVLAARGGGRAAWCSSCARIDRDRHRSGANGAGRVAGSGGAAGRGGRYRPLCVRGRGGDRVVAQAPRARSYREPAAGAGGGGIGRDPCVAADRGGTLPQRRADSLERSRRPLRRAGGPGARLSGLHRRTVAPARSSRWRMLASGMGS